jgi:hypothetical protein
MDEQEFLEQRQKEILERNGSRLQSNSLLESHNQTKNGRYYHGILTYISHPLGKFPPSSKSDDVFDMLVRLFTH